MVIKGQSRTDLPRDAVDCSTGIGPKRKALAHAVSVAVIAGIAPGPALAQSSQIEEIVVTATKRAESIMDVPIAITAGR